MAILKSPFRDTVADTADKRAEEALRQQGDAFDGLGMPDLAPLSLEDMTYEGDIDPALVGAAGNVRRGPDLTRQDVQAQTAELATQGDSGLRDIQVDPKLRDYQMQSLAALQDVASSGGLTAQDRAQLNRIQNDSARADIGRRAAILQNMDARGQGGSGNQLLAQLQSSQAATDRQAQQGMDTAALAEQRKLAAIQAVGSQGGALRGQDFDQAARVAAAQDAINNYNTGARNQANQFNAGVLNQNRQYNADAAMRTGMYNSDRAYDASKTDIANQMDTERYNATAKNAAATGNRDARQGVQSANATTHNQQAMYNKATIPQQQWDNQMKVASGKAQAASSAMDYYGNKADKRRAANGGMIGSGIAAIAAMYASDERAKTDVSDLSDEDIAEFLDSIEPKKFRYKDPAKHGDGQRAGVMVQDVEGTKLGKLITTEDDEGTKGFDKDKTTQLMLAVLGSIAKKVK